MKTGPAEGLYSCSQFPASKNKRIGGNILSFSVCFPGPWETLESPSGHADGIVAVATMGSKVGGHGGGAVYWSAWGSRRGGDVATMVQPLPMGHVLRDLSSFSCPRGGGPDTGTGLCRKEKRTFLCLWKSLREEQASPEPLGALQDSPLPAR